MKNLLRLLLKNQHQQNRSGQAQTEKGMTLVELLVGSIMAFLIITPMLAFVVDMLNTDRREQVKSNTEQDIQAAVDFIGQDLSQAIYIYDNNPATTTTTTTTPTGIPALLAGNFIPPKNATQTPILVFWKRQQIKNAVPVNSSIKPNQCETKANANNCNDTYVLSLVAYYRFKDKNSTWCQPSGDTCPTRIARYEIRDGVRNPYATDPTNPYYNVSDTEDTQQPDPAFDKAFELTKPTTNVTLPAGLTDPKSGVQNPQVLVNYIDHNPPVQALSATECQTALGNPSDPKDATKNLDEETLKVTDSDKTNSFYACVDTAKNIARVTIRGNSLRRLQDSNVPSSTENSAFFPTATVQVQGRGALGK
ncbi:MULTISPECIES: hormogonium polysaccharide secretion pseudopilin HpsC [unclassified Microcoleus]|uniref:hormogonium polysaccharide secretion pseudopilin HpsC n=1 Tax=unclassified Microcoleus TaxID=2642155 RepID=UPI0025D0D729|nr:MULTISPECIES: hormogonium polysaccharide secretion pseudopilin HpsC [unclassified Microcoleus]